MAACEACSAALHTQSHPSCTLPLTQTCARLSQLTPRLFYAFYTRESLVIHTAVSNVLDALGATNPNVYIPGVDL